VKVPGINKAQQKEKVVAAREVFLGYFIVTEKAEH
jgi:hypothetical protein